MSQVIFQDRMPVFVPLAEAALDRVLAETALEGIRLSIMQAPHLHGALWSSAKVERKGLGKFEASYNTPYAAYQEFGMRADGSRVVKNYSEPGSKKHYLKDPFDDVTNPIKLNAKFKAAGSSIRI